MIHWNFITKARLIALFAFINYIEFCFNADTKELRSVYEVFRHGARGPLLTPGQKNFFGNAWDGDGELTDVGKRMQYLFGRLIRNRYNGYLAPTYAESEYTVISTNVNRTIESGLAQLQGLYYQDPSIGTHLTTAQIALAYPPEKQFQSETLTVVNSLNDATLPKYMTLTPYQILDNQNTLFPLNGYCKNFNKFLTENAKDFAIASSNKFMLKYQSLLKTNFGIDNNSDLPTYNQVSKFCDQFVSDYYNMNDLSKVSPYKPDDMINDVLNFMGQEELTYVTGSAKNWYIPRIGVSAFQRDLLNYFDARISLDKNGNLTYYNSTSPKIKALSAHDTTMSAHLAFLMGAFNVDLTYLQIPFNSNILYELKMNPDKTYVVEIYYNLNLLITKPYPNYKASVSNILVSDDEIISFCEFTLNTDSYTDNSSLQTAILALSIIAIVFVLILGALIFFGKKFKIRRMNIFRDESIHETVPNVENNV